ncbi:sporulation protein rmd1 [Colletotrichum musicola]|uniref:Sporulation protein rmd1 n=1 Tax=Colletotrichum musicola TaxID=2175873 RepID=A0A8H6NUG8_9PEZI|nr:sporulation protein rmd1 [Colletotrichum musicola]
MDQATTNAGSASATENTPLLPTTENRPKTARTVTFNPNPVTKTIEPEPDFQRPRTSHSSMATSHGGQSSAISAINNKLRRRNSHGAVPSAMPAQLAPKIGPQRSTKNAQKLKLLPAPELEDGSPDEESGRDVYSQYTRIKDPTARRDAARLGKADRDRLPRVTAYCTANKYQMDNLMRFLKGRGKSRGANPKLIDECIYSAYDYSKTVENRHDRRVGAQPDPVQAYERRHSTGDVSDNGFHRDNLIDLHSEGRHDSGFADGYDGGNETAIVETNPDFDTQIHTPEVFLFDYGVVVIWGMTLAQEQRFLKEIAKFETEKLAPDDVETEHFNFYYTREYQARIYNDFITLRDKRNYMTKLAISHALAQSVKTSLFEELIASTVDTCKDIPTQIALTGTINLSRKQINMQIGELFILRINIHLNGSVLDTPELFWVEPQLEPVYQAVRSYLEMDQRVGLLTERLDVIADLLAVLKDQLSHGHGEKLEWIVIVLIAAEIVVAAINIVVDLYASD